MPTLHTLTEPGRCIQSNKAEKFRGVGQIALSPPRIPVLTKRFRIGFEWVEKGLPVSYGIIRLSILSGIFILIAGCGGSGGSTGGNNGGNNSGGNNNSTTVTVAFTNGTPTAVATKVGTGAFTAATLSNGSLTLSLPSDTTNFGVAYVCPPVTVIASSTYQRTNQNIIEASTLDGTSFSWSCGAASSTGATGTLTGSVDTSAISGVNYVDILAQNGAGQSDNPLNPPGGSFSFAAPTGTDRVEAVAYKLDQTSYGLVYSLVAAKNFSGVQVPGALNGGNTVVLSSADAVTLEPITYNGVPSGFSTPITLVEYSINNGGFLISNGVTSAYPAVPAAARESGDYYYFSSYAQSSSGEVVVDTASTSGGPLSVTFPPAWTYAGPAAAKWLSFDIVYTGFSGTTGVCDDVSMNWMTSSTAYNVVSLTATGNYLNGSTTVAIPDLSGLPGFVAAPASGITASWGASILQETSSCLLPYPSNSTAKIVSSGGVYTAP